MNTRDCAIGLHPSVINMQGETSIEITDPFPTMALDINLISFIFSLAGGDGPCRVEWGRWGVVLKMKFVHALIITYSLPAGLGLCGVCFILETFFLFLNVYFDF